MQISVTRHRKVTKPQGKWQDFLLRCTLIFHEFFTMGTMTTHTARRRTVLLLILPVLLMLSVATAQHADDTIDPRSHHLTPADDGAGPLLWGYEVDILMADLQRWAVHPWVSIDVIGYSVRGFPLFHVTLTNPSSTVRKKRIWVHSRTHPIESEASWVARAMIDELLSGSALATTILDNCIVHVLPMLNPDGVQLRYPRENANGVDIESNWGAAFPEPEVVALRNHLKMLMDTDAPIEVALNLHSAYQCRRYFVYHAAAGTSELFTVLQKRFIDMVRSRFPGGIEPYDYFVTWTGGTPDRYPESWFWFNYAERVMALTYEDMNCVSAGEYPRTARALLGGAAEYIGVLGPVNVTADMPLADAPVIRSLYPQPLNLGLHNRIYIQVEARASVSEVTVEVLDALGRVTSQLWRGEMNGRHVLGASVTSLSPGLHFVRLTFDGVIVMRPFVVIK
jgi:hypothetical protein